MGMEVVQQAKGECRFWLGNCGWKESSSDKLKSFSLPVNAFIAMAKFQDGFVKPIAISNDKWPSI